MKVGYRLSTTLGTAVLLMLSACKQNASSTQSLKRTVDSLEKVVSQSYRPGLGEFMTTLQLHHAKLWFAGTHENWQLADFEMHEVRETLDDIRTYASDRPEIGILGTIEPSIDSVQLSIKQQDAPKFREGFSVLTAACNHCHQQTGHGFNVITIPTSPPLSNQRFTTDSTQR